MKRMTVALTGLVAGAFLLLGGGAGDIPDTAGLSAPSATVTAEGTVPANIIW